MNELVFCGKVKVMQVTGVVRPPSNGDSNGLIMKFNDHFWRSLRKKVSERRGF